jgi:hypothetical protein
MSKNIFEEKNKISDIFETLNFNAKNIIPNEFEINSQKQAKKSEEMNLKDLPSKSNDLMKEEHETPSKIKKHVKINDTDSITNSSPPTMYKIALRIKKLAEVKVKKSTVTEAQSNNLLANETREECTEISKKKNSFKENKPVILSEVSCNEENNDVEVNYTGNVNN